MPNPDLDQLLNALVPFAQEMLSKHGEFYPFGASMNPAGEISAVAVGGEDEHPESEELVASLTEAFRKQAAAGEIRAAGICLDVRVVPPGQTDKTDAVKCCLEHQAGEAIDVYIPYRKGFLGRYKYAELFAGKRKPEFFV